MSDLLTPFTHAVAAVLAAAHSLLTSAGLDPSGATTWALAIALVVVAVRLAILPVVVHGVRATHAAAGARPHLDALRKKYRNRRDLESLQEMAREQRAIQAEHGMSRLGCLPVLLQLPVFFALYHVLAGVAQGRAVGAMDLALVASAQAAALMGVTFADRLGSQPTTLSHAVVVASLALTSAALSYATQRWFALPNMNLDQLPEAFGSAQRMMPAMSALGILAGAVVVPVGLLIYWVATNAWALGQQAAIARWWPTPGTPAYAAKALRASRGRVDPR